MPGLVRSPRHDRVLGVAGAVLLLAAAGVHLDLYVTGYRDIPTIGPLFLVQVVAAAVLSVAVVVTTGSGLRSLAALAAAGAAAVAAGTVAAYGVSRAGSLFGFHERPTTTGLVAGLLEAGAFAAFGALAAGLAGQWARSRRTAAPPEATGKPGGGRDARRRRHAGGLGLGLGLGAATVALVALVLATGLGAPAGPASPARPAAATSPAPVVHVVISNFAFQPARVVARPGATLAVTNEDQVAHTMTALPGSVPFGRFSTGLVDPGHTVRIHAPEAAGRYRFSCSVHPFMTGLLVVSR